MIAGQDDSDNFRIKPFKVNSKGTKQYISMPKIKPSIPYKPLIMPNWLPREAVAEEDWPLSKPSDKKIRKSVDTPQIILF
jgi:hypothetical protein